MALIIALLFSMIGVVSDPAAASEHGAQSDVLREKAPQSSEPSTPTNGQEVPNEHSDGGLGEPDSRESSAPTAPGAAKSESPTVSPPTRVDAQAVTIACSPGNVYSVNRTGQLQLVDSSGSVTNVGTSASSVGSFNGLGIGSGGDAIYAYERTNSSQTATIYQFDPSAEKWTSTGTSYNTSLSSNGSFNGSLIAGAVDLSSSAGNYYFGGFNSGGTQFKLWRYDPTTKSVTYLGYVNTASGGGSSNGDIAFDSQGNLFIARGIGTTTTIFSVTNDAIAAANGGQIAAADSRGVTTVSGVNGLAFDASGKAYLGAGSTVTSYDMPNWTNAKTVTSSLSATTDLASCSSPATITLEKEVMSRVNGGDQFGLSLSSGSNILGTATTSGSANGIQSQRVGPLPVARGTSISFSEAGAGATDLNNYASSYSCAADGNPINIAGDGVSGSLTIPATGNEIICRFMALRS